MPSEAGPAPTALGWALLAATLLASGCGVADAGGATLVRRTDPVAIQAACQLADRRCTQCHQLDRVMALTPYQRGDWAIYVRRMRLTPGSGIPAAEESPIVSCLQYRSFGPPEAP